MPDPTDLEQLAELEARFLAAPERADVALFDLPTPAPAPVPAPAGRTLPLF